MMAMNVPLWNVVMLGVSFMLVFTGFQTCANIEVSTICFRIPLYANCSRKVTLKLVYAAVWELGIGTRRRDYREEWYVYWKWLRFAGYYLRIFRNIQLGSTKHRCLTWHARIDVRRRGRIHTIYSHVPVSVSVATLHRQRYARSSRRRSVDCARRVLN
jgi:hypothetical protein